MVLSWVSDFTHNTTRAAYIYLSAACRMSPQAMASIGKMFSKWWIGWLVYDIQHLPLYIHVATAGKQEWLIYYESGLSSEFFPNQNKPPSKKPRSFWPGTYDMLSIVQGALEAKADAVLELVKHQKGFPSRSPNRWTEGCEKQNNTWRGRRHA